MRNSLGPCGIVALAVTLMLMHGGCALFPLSERPRPSMRVHAFYYPWYANPETDGEWGHWNHQIAVPDAGAYEPPDQIGANFYPLLGLYSSNSEDDLSVHMRQLRYARVGVISVSWWGKGDFTDKTIPRLLDVASKHRIKVGFHIEPFSGRSAATTKEAIMYIIDRYGSHPAFYRDRQHGGRPMFYIYDSYLVPDADWATILSPSGENTIRGTKYDSIVIGLYVKEGDWSSMRDSYFDGFYTYFATDGFTYGSSISNWAGMAHWAKQNDKLFIPSVGPGYADTRIRPWNVANQRGREDGAYYDRMWDAALDVCADFVSITSFNEWHEGTQIEPAVFKTVPGYTYLDYRPHSPGYYLLRTRYWIELLDPKLRAKHN